MNSVEMSANDGSQDVSKCFVFKSRLQEYVQKVGLSTPIYETIKEGPPHEPSFRSTVIVNGVRYDSLSGFFNRKAAEQSAAEVALVAFAQNEDKNDCISLPVNETGLCKNLLQEYAQKMNYAMPTYSCKKYETPAKMILFSCTVDIGGINYIGAASKTKKEAEIKAARTALLAIQMSDASEASSERPFVNSMYTVLPCRKKGKDFGISSPEIPNILKSKKKKFKKKPPRKRRPGPKSQKKQFQDGGSLDQFSCGEPNGTQLQVPISYHEGNSGVPNDVMLSFHGDGLPTSFLNEQQLQLQAFPNKADSTQEIVAVDTIPFQDNHKDPPVCSDLDTAQTQVIVAMDPITFQDNHKDPPVCSDLDTAQTQVIGELSSVSAYEKIEG
ncbi:double-stranded RNA-binding protein 1-like [Impatiens glandulifera]|uniref:double-stranded RNA-binding protein 1-like n=1 Tax=Impatiens glandulifera TaxID=253017 RepID=UPI001FB0F37E|nr:double-stranded RNA-binding protein 1-like [Impatiens glandulifera]XP_047329545.1 double-stranded RNA-binding protein 1-like [Impatiens glandulifera]